MDIDNNYARNIFATADINKDNLIDQTEVAVFTGKVQDKSILQQTFNQGSITMSISDYMQAMNRLKDQLGLAVCFTDTEIKWADKEYVLAEVQKNCFALKYADSLLQADKDIVLAAMYGSAEGQYYASSVLSYASPILKADKDFMLEVISQNNWLLKIADKSITAEAEDYSLFQKIAKTTADLAHLNIFRPEYMRNAQDAQKIILWREQIKAKTLDISKPTVMIIFPREDGNRGGFRQEDNFISQFLDQGYQVCFYEVATDKEFYSAITEVGGVCPIQLLIIGGHGRPDGLTFNARVHKNPSQADELDLSDEIEIQVLGLPAQFAPKAEILLYSCEVGSGGAGADNLANSLKRAFPQITIYSSTEDTMMPVLSFDAEGRILKLNEIYENNTYIPN